VCVFYNFYFRKKSQSIKLLTLRLRWNTNGAKRVRHFQTDSRSIVLWMLIETYLFCVISTWHENKPYICWDNDIYFIFFRTGKTFVICIGFYITHLYKPEHINYRNQRMVELMRFALIWSKNIGSRDLIIEITEQYYLHRISFYINTPYEQ